MDDFCCEIYEVKWAGQFAWLGEINAFRILVGKPLRKQSLRRGRKITLRRILLR
jgi:hypothetical protein